MLDALLVFRLGGLASAFALGGLVAFVAGGAGAVSDNRFVIAIGLDRRTGAIDS